MIEPRIYRAAFLPALLALVLVAFSLESPPRPLDQGLAADALFEGDAAIHAVGSIVAAAPDRHAGGPGDEAVARRVATTFRANGFTTAADRWDEDGRTLTNVVGQRAGASSREIVVLAARDSDRPPDAPGSAADTAALMQFAQVFEGRALRHTLVLASVDGGQLGDAGARRFVQQLPEPGNVEAVIVLSELGAQRSRGPLVIGWSNDTTRAGIGLERTVNGSLREELGTVPKDEDTLAQFARLAFPIAPGGQAPLLENGIDAVRVGGAGEIDRGGDGLADVNVDRYGSLGRSALRVIATLDGSPREPAGGPRAYLGLGGMVLPAWALELLAIALVLPALVASIDALARARRRREAVGPWFPWLAVNALPFVAALLLAWLMSLVGLIDDAPPAPLDPTSLRLDASAVSALVATALVALLAWVLTRTHLLRRRGPRRDAAEPGAACASSLVLSVLVLAIALVNPFAALVLVPAAHLWMVAALTGVRARTSAVLFAIGIAPVLFVAAYYTWRLELSPVSAAWYLLLLFTGNQPGLLTTAACIVLAAVTASFAAVLVARIRAGVRGDGPRRDPRKRRPDEPRPSIFGPGGHAGPGAIGSVGTGRR